MKDNGNNPSWVLDMENYIPYSEKIFENDKLVDKDAFIRYLQWQVMVLSEALNKSYNEGKSK